MSMWLEYIFFFIYIIVGIAQLYNQLHQPPRNLFQPLPSSLQHPQSYKNENIVHNWAISPNLRQKIQSYLLCLKIGTHGIFEVVVPNRDLDFWNSNPKSHFWANLARKSKSCPFCLKIGSQNISRMLILIPALISFLNFQPEFHFCVNLRRKSQSCPFYLIFSAISFQKFPT